MTNQASLNNKVSLERAEEGFELRSGGLLIAGDLKEGSYRYEWGGEVIIRRARTEFTADGASYAVTFAASHELSHACGIEDAFGSGMEVQVDHRFSSGLTLTNTFRIYEGLPYFLLQSAVRHAQPVRSNRIVPLTVKEADGGEVAFPGEEAPLSLFVPFDNDKWVRYGARPLEEAIESYEVGALFAPRGGDNALVAGSLTHDAWKSAIHFTGSGSQVSGLTVYAGAASELTRDTLPHGELVGEDIRSPWMFVGSFSGVEEGLEAFADANALLVPALPWEEGVPFGWNSWSAVGGKLTKDTYTAASDFIKDRIQDHGFHNEGIVYINFDSFWTGLTEEELAQAVQHVQDNGHRAGIYWTPFAFWGNKPEQLVEGTNGQYRYIDLLLKDGEGNVLPDLDGGLAIDPTHPGTLQRIDWQVEMFHRFGFEYIKLDFMGHGALEGQHAAEHIHTGVQAYTYGMNYLHQKLSASPAGRRMFINLSIAPLFPYHYAHSRRISCDAFAKIEDTAYMLNALTYGWWIHQRLYAFNDPDHTVLFKSFNQEPVTEAEARSRYHASAIAGTVMLLGDDFRLEEAAERVAAVAASEAVNEIARAGVTFKPLRLSSGDEACDVFLRRSADGNAEYVAVFNYTKESAVKPIPLSLLGKSGEDAGDGEGGDEAPAVFRNVRTGEVYRTTEDGVLHITLAAMDSVILQVVSQ
ncbi:alpha-galactosidase [Paenibacillaceae bacterium]|nr:alpha-galactosidase [Paenibacillaceae bacterium]